MITVHKDSVIMRNPGCGTRIVHDHLLVWGVRTTRPLVNAWTQV